MRKEVCLNGGIIVSQSRVSDSMRLLTFLDNPVGDHQTRTRLLRKAGRRASDVRVTPFLWTESVLVWGKKSILVYVVGQDGERLGIILYG